MWEHTSLVDQLLVIFCSDSLTIQIILIYTSILRFVLGSIIPDILKTCCCIRLHIPTELSLLLETKDLLGDNAADTTLIFGVPASCRD
jgi:hypothetical protein